MPIGIQRLNAKKSQPNSFIVFIKPLKGPDESIAQDFLERIAAQCLPIMREHSLSIMSLEEYEPNREFVGRNFNAGEVIQLVLKSPSTGRWLPFHYVQMVMMHEYGLSPLSKLLAMYAMLTYAARLAHCKQMNHSRAFWAVRNKYAEQMRQLWSQGYAGEGLWGRGALLTTGEFESNMVQAGEVLPDHLCGGTYRSRRRKRRANGQLTYQQRKERRILKKFGANGVVLGEDEVVKAELEKGKRTQAKPRVAGSKRGRELRAAAALARFDQKKPEGNFKTEIKAKDEDEDTAASEDEYETASESEDDASDATDIAGKRILDGKGHRMIKVCEDENPEDGDAQNELRELQLSMKAPKPAVPPASSSKETNIKRESDSHTRLQDLPCLDKSTVSVPRQSSTVAPGVDAIKREGEKEIQSCEGPTEKQSLQGSTIRGGTSLQVEPRTETMDSASVVAPSVSKAGVGVCPLCSMENGPVSLTCVVCCHVLDGSKDPRAWKCSSTACQRSSYLNAGDAGLCGVCGARKPTS
ncbi:WLM domain-containing protein [Seiridium cupressi]